MKKIEIFNDPIYGFIYIQNPLIFKIIEHPYFQRLRRITQMGMSYLVYPGAHHTRFHHAIGCGFLMQKAIETLRLKDIEISKEEEEALLIAILLHDIGHGPFSHALENSFIEGIHHEDISLHFMHKLNNEFDGKLSLAIQIFKNEYHKKYFYQLISSQLDMDRLDYLKRDSFYSGVVEGNINAERLIAMLNVKDDALVIEEKGIYSVEKFIVARRLMYWLVYLHKTSLAAEYVLIKTLQRAKDLIEKGVNLSMSLALKYFISNKIIQSNFENEALVKFSELDDYDILSALKSWSTHSDYILSSLSRSIIDRKLPKVEMQNQKFKNSYFEEKLYEFSQSLPVEQNNLHYFVFKGKVQNKAYKQNEKGIQILMKSGNVVDIVSASDELNLQSFKNSVTKYFICYPK
ncbi:MAG: HD domain-containing protein [Bacteroidota bacterium]